MNMASMGDTMMIYTGPGVFHGDRVSVVRIPHGTYFGKDGELLHSAEFRSDLNRYIG